ncbi:catalase 1 [Exophiala dermatitidis]|uniref:Catalase n=1 Tax=Exophiala dermatitidis TaxID=5970 RepID=A0AAN6EPI3_EXODE|nr:catalase 1 [Exophiala dermatitidis]KAJ4514973.1 catalase 1 [Exophiala dermatitidis]KAJ4517464.1 catalase 1 [Exophiala dermatitidis]KAJ4548783.1 catalase 1 [Exophiala dermatitidis]KAJ4550575.1 catalase 1 [Exophiala dermatitidis]
MASSVADKVRNIGESVAESVTAMTENKKVADLQKNVKDAHSKQNTTTDYGIKVSDLDHWLKPVDEQNNTIGPHALEDQIARERIMRFDHERIPERVVHARGAAAHGTFRLFESAEDVTTAGVLTDTSRTTPVFVRFSTVQGSRGSADTVRDVRGFATKFYTEEGNWDIVGNDIPVFFIQESIKFPDLVHAVKPEPDNEVPQAQTAHNNFWDFVYLHKEATHMFFWAMSDRGIPRSYRMMQGFGVNTFSLINAKGERTFCKFIWTPELGVHSFVWDEALKLAGQDPDFHRKDLYEAIDNKAYPKWKLGLQLIPEKDEHKFDFDILDATKVWPEELVPIRYIGEMELNRNVDEYFTETEQVAFCTSHIVPGIDFTNDPLLQGRNFSYFDTQLSRLGINWQELPINRPVCPVLNFNRDGQGRHTITKGKVNYWPNRYEANPPTGHGNGGFESFPSRDEGMKQRKLAPKWKDYLSQAQLFWNSMTPIEKRHIINAFSFELDHCDDPVVYERLVSRLTEIDLSLAAAVAEKVGAPTPTKQATPNPGHKAKGLSQLEYLPVTPTIKSRRVAILIADGYDAAAYDAMKAAVLSQLALPFTMSTKRQEVKASNGTSSTKPDHFLNGQRSTMFDAIFIPGGEQSVKTLMGIGLARFWVREAFAHLKPIAASGEGVKLVDVALREAEGVKLAAEGSTDVVDWYGVVTAQKPDTGSSVKDSIKLAKEATDFTSKFFWHISQHRNWDRELDGLADQVTV